MLKETLLEKLKVIATGQLDGKDLSREDLMKLAESVLNQELKENMEESKAHSSKICQELNIDQSKLNDEGIMSLEKEVIKKALEKFKGNLSDAAKYLKMGRATLYRKAKEYKIILQRSR